MTRSIDRLQIEGYLRADCYSEGIRTKMAKAVRECKDKVSPDSFAQEVLVKPDSRPSIEFGRAYIEAILESGSIRQISEILISGAFVPSENCNYRELAESTTIPHELQVGLAGRFIELAQEQERSRETKPNRAGVGIIIATTIATIAGLGEREFVAGVIASVVTACFFWRKNEKKIDESVHLAVEIVASGKLTSDEARQTFLDFLGFARPEDIEAASRQAS